MTQPRRTAPLRLYLAGPDVFLAGALDLAARKKALCVRYGFAGVFPLDKSLDLEGLAPRDRGLAIARANERLMDGCDLMVAHMTPFRGPGMDGGTAFEMGYMRAQGKPVLGYSNVPLAFFDRVAAAHGCRERAGDGHGFEDRDGLAIENFDLVDNLMLDGAVIGSGFEVVTAGVVPDALYTDLTAFERCLAMAAGRLGTA